MLDYIAVLLEALDQDPAYLDGDYCLLRDRELQADAALCATLSPEQLALYLACEEARNNVSSLTASALARRAFLLAREIYR